MAQHTFWGWVYGTRVGTYIMDHRNRAAILKDAKDIKQLIGVPVNRNLELTGYLANDR